MSFCSNRYFVSWEQTISCRLKFSSAFGSFVHVCCNSVYIIVVIAQCFELWGGTAQFEQFGLKEEKAAMVWTCADTVNSGYSSNHHAKL